MHFKIIFSFLVISYGTFVNGQTASIQYASSARFQIDPLKFGCSPSNTGWSGITRVTLSKNVSTLTSLQEIVRVELDTAGVIRNKTTWGTGNYQSRAEMIRQYVNPLAGAGVEFDIRAESVQCSDEGLYYCEVDGLSTTNTPIKRTSTGTVTLQVVPTSINPITVFPTQQEFIYNPMSQITMTCRGEVGRPAGDLTWCYKNSNSQSFIGWPFASDIKQDTATQSGCNFVRSSTLTYNVSADYRFTEFKCVTGSLSCSGGQGVVSANVTIFRYTSTAGNTDEQSGDTANGGVIAGAVIGSFIGVVVIVVVVYLVFFRNPGSGESYRTKEENGTGGNAPIDNTVYSVPHKDRDRHAPRDKSPRHHENKGFDEPHTRRLPSMDPQGGRGGRTNPGMERSFDDVRDGGNGLRNQDFYGSNASFGSAV